MKNVEIELKKIETDILVIDPKAIIRFENGLLIRGSLSIRTSKGSQTVGYNKVKNMVSFGCQSHNFNKLMGYLSILEGGKVKNQKCIVKNSFKGKASQTLLAEESNGYYISGKGRAYNKDNYKIVTLTPKALFPYTNKDETNINVYGGNSYYTYTMTKVAVIKSLKEVKKYVEFVKEASILK